MGRLVVIFFMIGRILLNRDDHRVVDSHQITHLRRIEVVQTSLECCIYRKGRVTVVHTTLGVHSKEGKVWEERFCTHGELGRFASIRGLGASGCWPRSRLTTLLREKGEDEAGVGVVSLLLHFWKAAAAASRS